MINITFLTGNQDKINSAKQVFSKYPEIALTNQKIDLPEIQSMDVTEVAKYSAGFAAEKLNRAVIKLDCGYYVPALNDFPGPFVKYFQNAISMEDFLKLMDDKSDRKIIVRECLGYAAPGQETKVFTAEIEATLAKEPQGEGGLFDRLIIYKGFDKPQAACNYDEIVEYWNKYLDHYEQFAKFISSSK